MYVKKNTYICTELKSNTMGIFRKKKENDAYHLREELNIQKIVIEDLKAQHKVEMKRIVMKSVRDVGVWVERYKAMEELENHWRETSMKLQATIDASNNIKNQNEFLALVRAVKYIANFKLPE